MSIGPTGMIGSVAGSPLAQGQGSEVNKAQQDTADQKRQVDLADKAGKAEGIGQTEQEEQASDRDADGRRPWEIGGQAAEQEPDDAGLPASEKHGARDPSGERGQHLDLNG